MFIYINNLCTSVKLRKEIHVKICKILIKENIFLTLIFFFLKNLVFDI